MFIFYEFFVLRHTTIWVPRPYMQATYIQQYFRWNTSGIYWKHRYTITWGYRNWPRYGLRWSGLCWHSRHSTSGAGRRAAACGRTGRLHECCAGSGSTNHDSADHMSGQFLFYHENEAMHNDKSHDAHDDESSCWNALADNVIVMMKASIDTASE